ncbi:MAG: ATP synthase F1 subunit gamma [Candidatus Dojkabacteria bacterium]
MPLNAKAIKTKISSVKNTRKITKAMEMIAAAKMRKAVEAANNSREYTKTLSSIVAQILANSELETSSRNYLRTPDEAKKTLLVLVSSNKGLCGSYNSSVMASARQYLSENELAGRVDMLAIGRKGAKFAKYNDANLLEIYEDIPDNPTVENIGSIIMAIKNRFKSGEYRTVHVAFTEFQTSLVQKAIVLQLLPMSIESMEMFQSIAGELSVNDPIEDTHESELIFEPSAAEVLDYSLERVLEAQILQVFLESLASEHSARMIAMKNASDAASDMVDELTLEYNKSRQAAITQEIAEISNAAEAIK